MLACFLRHAEAEASARTDFDRALTPKGVEQAVRAGSFCRRAGLVPDVLWSSPVVRARQTAQIVARALRVEVTICPWLACGMSPDQCLERLREAVTKKAVLLVGHEPDFGDTIARLLGIEHSDVLKIRKASLIAIELPSVHAGGGQLQFLVPARLMSP